MKPIPVGLGDVKGSRLAGDVLVCFGLGSCVGVAVYDPKNRVAGMAHVVLPDSSLARQPDVPGKFADTAVPALLDEMVRLGGSRKGLVVKIAGGARMLAGLNSARLDIGSRNVEAVRAVLARLGVTPVAEDTGGNYGRTCTLHVDGGRLVVSTVGRGEKVL